MKPHEIEKMLIGKTISKISSFKHIWPMCIEEIHFTDGTVLDLSGNADYARIEGLTINKEWVGVDDAEDLQPSTGVRQDTLVRSRRIL